jgi:hypothetical protein
MLPQLDSGLGEVDFWIFNFLQFTIDGKNNSKTTVEKVFFFIFMHCSKSRRQLPVYMGNVEDQTPDGR